MSVLTVCFGFTQEQTESHLISLRGTTNVKWPPRSEESEENGELTEPIQMCDTFAPVPAQPNVVCQTPPTMCAYTAPVLLNPCAHFDIYTTGSFLYWKAAGNYLAYAFVQVPLHSVEDQGELANLLPTGFPVIPDFNYQPGYRLGIGYKIDRDHWDLYAEYTCFHQTVNSEVIAPTIRSNILPIWLLSINNLIYGNLTPANGTAAYRQAKSFWLVNLDILDAETGRNLFLGTHLTIRPSIGLRNLWLNQKYNVSYLTTDLPSPINGAVWVNSFNHSRSWGIGPKFGLTNTWNLLWGFKILGNIDASLLYVQEHISATQLNPLIAFSHPSGPKHKELAYQTQLDINTLKPILDMSLGLGWGRSFFCDKIFWDFLLNYDFSIYFNQSGIQLGQAPLITQSADNGFVSSSIGSFSENDENLSIHGLRATVRFDF